jgi:hypothetical protein
MQYISIAYIINNSLQPFLPLLSQSSRFKIQLIFFAAIVVCSIRAFVYSFAFFYSVCLCRFILLYLTSSFSLFINSEIMSVCFCLVSTVYIYIHFYISIFYTSTYITKYLLFYNFLFLFTLFLLHCYILCCFSFNVYVYSCAP